MKTVVIFGSFDGIHEGHLDFFTQARSYGEVLVAIVARSSSILSLKGRLPLNDDVSRVNSLLDIHEVDRVLLGDEEVGVYKALMEVNPDVIFLGYDQNALKESLEKSMRENIIPRISIEIGKPYKEDIFHSSLLNK